MQLPVEDVHAALLDERDAEECLVCAGDHTPNRIELRQVGTNLDVLHNAATVAEAR